MFLSGAALAQEAGDKPKEEAQAKAALPKCPVGGEEVNFAVSTDTADGPIYFCCSDCKGKFAMDAGPYAEKVKQQREALKKTPRVQTACPGSGEAIDVKVFTEKDGERVYFCCNDCKTSYEASPAKYAKKLESCYTYQARCPVMGAKIKPNMYVTLASGARVYFCCDMCDRKFVADPGKYAKKLEAQGYKYDAEALKAPKPAKEPEHP
jgi:YHS domain-containing protein